MGRRAGWGLIVAGIAVLGWLGWQLWGTGVRTEAAQSGLRADLLEAWLEQTGDGTPVLAGAEDFRATAAPAEPPADGAAVALMEFARPGASSASSSTAPLPASLAGAVAVVAGVGAEDLKRGPGHYPGTADPGQPGNMAIAGHRTTYGAPFADLDRLESGDEVRVTDRSGVRAVYRVREQRIVAPGDVWVLMPDPLGTGTPTLTLTTCHPRFSNRQRLVVFAELVDGG